MKPNTQTKSPTLSRQLQKIFIVTTVLAYLVQLVLVGGSIYPMLIGHFPGISAFVIYPITTLGLPLLSFLLFTVINSTSYTRLWRICQAAMVAFLAVVVEGFLSALNLGIFSRQLGYGDVPASENSPLLQGIPLVVTLVAVAVFSMWLRRPKTSHDSDVSVLFQKVFVVLLPLSALGQIVVMYFGYTSGGALGQAFDSGVLISELFSLAIPVIVWIIVFLLTAREKTILQRVFTSSVYLVIGILLVTTCMSLVYLASLMSMGPQGGMLNTLMNTVSLLLALVLFTGLVIWHKRERLL